MALTILTGSAQSAGVNYSYRTSGSADWSSVPTSSYFYDQVDQTTRYKMPNGVIVNAISSSYAVTASFALSGGGGGSTFPYTGSAIISGSLDITGSLSVFNQSVNSNVLNTNTYSLRDSNNLLRIDWGGGVLYDAAATASVNFRTRVLRDSSDKISTDWNNRSLNDIAGSTSLDWKSRLLYDSTSTGKLALDWRLRKLHDLSTSQSLDWTNRIQIDAAGITTTAWEVRRHYDTNTSQSINWGARDLTDTNESSSINWSSRILTDSGNPGGSGFSVSSVDWENRDAYDAVGNLALQWNNRVLYDGSSIGSLDWGTRTLIDTNSNTMIDYSGGTGYSIFNFRPTIENLSEQVQEDFTQTTTFGLAGNVAGNVIFAGTNIDLAVTASNPVFLDSDGVWKQINQTTDNNTKFLGICVEGYNKGQVLTEGIITVTTSSGYFDTIPFISGSSFYGMPVYITGSTATYTTDKPTSGYVRVIGHMYYNSTTNPDYWIMKFNPSNDWYEI